MRITKLCRDTGGKGTLPAQHTTFNTLDNWTIKTPRNQKGKGPERKGYRVWPGTCIQYTRLQCIHNMYMYICKKKKKKKKLL